MSDGTLLVLGASHHQLDVIAAGRRRRLRVAVADNVPSNPGHRLADVSHHADTTDVDAIERVARAERVDGIVAAATDVAVPTAATVAARLGLPGVSPEIADLITSKAAFRCWQRGRGLPAPEAVALAEGQGVPGPGRWVVKPERSSGSKGVRVVEAGEDVAPALEAARRIGPGVVVAERPVEGHHVTVEALLADGVLQWSVVLDRQTARAPWCATTGHRVPTTLPDARAAAATTAVARTVEELGLRDGPLDADLVVGDEAVVLELSPRLGGNSIGKLLRLAMGVDLADAAIDAALGRETRVPAPARPRPCAVVLLGADRDGELAYDASKADALRAEEWVAGLDLAPAGTPVRAFTDGRAVVGRAFVTAHDRDGVDARADEVVRRLPLEGR